METPNNDQQKVIDLIDELTKVIGEAYQKGCGQPHAMSALLNVAAVIAVRGNGTSKEFGITARTIFNQMRSAMRAGR